MLFLLQTQADHGKKKKMSRTANGLMYISVKRNSFKTEMNYIYSIFFLPVVILKKRKEAERNLSANANFTAEAINIWVLC